MKKTLVLASLLAAFGAASAQSSVTLFGWVDAAVGQAANTTTTGGVKSPFEAGSAASASLNAAGTVVLKPAVASTLASFAPSIATTAAGNGVSQTQLRSGDMNGSRWGIRGSEALGNGLKAKFQLESGFGVDNGAAQQQSRLFGRQAFVGVDGGFGSITMGRHYPSYDSARAAQDTTGHSSFSTSGLFNNFGRDYTFRADNSIRFDSANYSGFTVSATIGLGEDKTATAAASGLQSFHAMYKAGPVMVVAAMQSEKMTGSAGTTGLGQTNGASAAAGNSAGSTKETHTLIAGSYNFGVAKLNVGYNTSKDNGTAVGNVADKEMHVGVNIPFGAAGVNLTYGTSKQANKYKASGFGAELNYSLSPRTHVYAAMTDLKGDNAASGVAAASVQAVKIKAAAVGVRHSF